jgi:hypothetical protein
MELIINIFLVVGAIVGFIAAFILASVIVGSMILVFRIIVEELDWRF